FESSTTYAGGVFTTVGNGLNSPGLAKWRDFLPPKSVGIANASAAPGGAGGGGLVAGVFFNPTVTIGCASSGLGRTPGRGGDPVELGTVAFGEFVVTEDTQPPADVPLAFEVRDASDAVIVRDTVVVETAEAVTFVLTGVDDPGAYAPNPTGLPIGLAVRPVQVFGEGAVPEGEALVRFLHAVTDAPALDVLLPDGTVLADSVVFDALAARAVVPLGTASVEVRRHNDGALLGTFELALTEEEDVQVAVLAGFLDPAANQDGPPLTLFTVPVPGTVSVSSESPANATPDRFTLDPAYPNPFRSATTLRVGVPHAADVAVEVFDLLGRRVAVLAGGRLEAGPHALHWEADGLPSGVYVVRMRAGDAVRAQRVTLLR
ncbi:MAG: T9SS type A sorting domain-containing protein, partial [Rhodothermales bacterium]|nr:T9SS type A sorting domain-containing protein [Rhodothermales bacterium]